jgi:PAS domain S-box-containing protein
VTEVDLVTALTSALLIVGALVAGWLVWRWWRLARLRRGIAPVANAEAMRLEELLEASPWPACITDRGRVGFMNPPMAALSGAALGGHFGDLFAAGKDRDRATAAGHGEGMASDDVLQLQRRDDTVRYVAITTVPAYGRGDGVYLQWLFDRTAQRESQQVATIAQARHESILQGLADSIVIINERGLILSFSPAAEKVFGYQADEIVGRNISLLMPPPDCDRHDEYLREYVEAGWASSARERMVLTGNAQIVRPERETVALRKDGTRFPIRLVVSEVDTGEERFFVGLLSDLTERKMLEKEVADRAAFQEALLESIPYPMFVVDASGCLVSCNDPHTQTFGTASTALLGRTIRELPYLAEDTRAQLHERAQEVIRDGSQYSQELTVTHADGSSHVAIFSADGFRTSAGLPGGLIGLLVDITDQKRTAAELKIAKEKAEHAHAIIEVQRRRMQNELDVGRHIQMSMVPGQFPELATANVWGMLRPAREVGGDFYDFFMPTEHEIWLCIGDVSGKGVPAALLMAVTKTLIKSFATQGRTPGEVATQVNEELSRDNDTSMFVTAFIAKLDLRSGELCYTNAGHNPPFVRRATGDVERYAARHGVVLGAAEDQRYGESLALLSPGDTLLLYTDGVTEAMDTTEQLFGDLQLQDVMRQAPFGSAQELAAAVVASVDRFADGAEQADDITLLSLRYGPRATTSSPDRHTLQVRNDLTEITAALRQVEGLVARCGGDRETQSRFASAFDELLSNIVKYGYPDGGAHLIDCEIRREGNAIRAVISDDGTPFDPTDAPEPDTALPLEERALGGLGIHLVRQMFDGVRYQRQSGRNVLTLSRAIHPGAASGE